VEHSIVIPIHKPGKPTRQATSYRPISLTSCLGKLLERIITVRLTHYLNTNNIIPLQQSGFRADHSTADHLATLSDDVNRTISNRGTTLAVFIDIEKAFDNLDHATLLTKLANINLSDNILANITDFLHNRQSCIKVKQFYSNPFTVSRGVPHGSVISPTLFNIYLYDLPSAVSNQRHVRISLFADDVAIWASSTTRAGPKLITKYMQTALNELDDWAHTNKLALSQTKTVAVQFTKRLNLPQPELKLNNQPIVTNTSAKFLGVIFDNRLTFTAHANYIKQRCQPYINIMRCVSHTTWGCNIARLKTLYTALIQSTTLYGIEATHIMSQAATNLLTKLQMQALRICLGAFPSTPINILLAETNVLPLNIQIDRRLTIFCGKIKLTEHHPSKTINEDSWHNYYGTLNRSSTLLKTQKFFQSLELHPPLLIPVDDDLPSYLWKSPTVNTELSLIINKNQNLTIIKASFLLLQQATAAQHLHVYTDASLDISTGKVGVGVYIDSKQDNDQQLSLRLNDNHSIYTAELVAIQRSIELYEFILNPLKLNYHIFSDSLSALTSIKAGFSQNNPTLLRNILTQINFLMQNGTSVYLTWCPAHVGVDGNERADTLAKASLTNTYQSPVDYELGDLKRRASQNAHTLHKNAYRAHKATSTNQYFTLRPCLDTPSPLGLATITNRHTAVIIFRLATQHCRLNHHLKQLGMAKSNICNYCNCNEISLFHYCLYMR
jgi:ribonuclease HI